MKVTEDIYFADNYHLNQPLPKFYWMKINGIENKMDFSFLHKYIIIAESFPVIVVKKLWKS
jgi:hypothetical protein